MRFGVEIDMIFLIFKINIPNNLLHFCIFLSSTTNTRQHIHRCSPIQHAEEVGQCSSSSPFSRLPFGLYDILGKALEEDGLGEESNIRFREVIQHRIAELFCNADLTFL